MSKQTEPETYPLEIDDLSYNVHPELEERETIEIYEDKEWKLGVYLGKNTSDLYDGKENQTQKLYLVQILNQDEKMEVEFDRIRKFKGCDAFTMYINFITISMGAGILSLTWALAGASLIPGLILIFLSMVYIYYTCSLVLITADEYNYDNMAKIVEKSLKEFKWMPPLATQIFNITTIATYWLSTILCLMGYYFVIFDQGSELIDHFNIGETFKKGFLYVIGPLVICLLSFLPNYMFSWTSMLSLFITFLIIAALIKENCDYKPATDWKYFGFGRGYLCLISNMMMAMGIQYNIPSLYKEVQIRDSKKIMGIMRNSFATVYAIYAIVIVLAYVQFGAGVDGNILKLLHLTPLGIIVRIGMVIIVMCCAPLVALPITDDVQIWYYNFQRKRANGKNLEDKEIDMEAKDSWILKVSLQLLNIFVISFPAFMQYIFAKYLDAGLELVNVINGIIVLFWYCSIIPYVVSPNKSTFDKIMVGVGMILTVLAAAFTKTYTEDL